MKTPQTVLFGPSYVGMQSVQSDVVAEESKLRLRLTRERKKLNSQVEGRHYFPTGDIVLHNFVFSAHEEQHKYD